MLTAQPTDGGVAVHCGGGVLLNETLMPRGVAQDCSHIELVYAAVRGAGFLEDHIVIQGLDALPREVIEVAAPISGIVVDTECSIGPVWLAPSSAASEILTSFNPRPDLADEFEQGHAIARTYIEAARLHDAEQVGLDQIETTLSWLTVRANYGFSALPNGDASHFKRTDAIARCRRLPLVSTRGMEETRRWLRRPTSDRIQTQIELTKGSTLPSPPMPEWLPASDANALRTARRAIEPGDAVQRVHALWEAFEFYVGAASLPSLFNDADRRAVLDAVRALLSAEQHDRLSKMVNGPLNSTPLMEKLMTTLVAEGVHVSPAEEKTLRRLRRVRGRTAHGSTDLPSSDDLQRGCCVLARALTIRLHRLDKTQ